MQFNRFKNDKIQDGIDADSLLNNDIFISAVEEVLNNYAENEEKLIADDSIDVREATARIKKNAMMRRALLDVVSELENIVFAGKDAKLDDEPGE